MHAPARTANAHPRTGMARLHGVAAALWAAGLAGYAYLALIRPAPLFAGSGSLPEELLPWLGALALLVLATTPGAWRWWYLRRHRDAEVGRVRVDARAGRVALLFPLSLGAWLSCRQLGQQVDAHIVFGAGSALYFAAALLTLTSALRWLRHSLLPGRRAVRAGTGQWHRQDEDDTPAPGG